MNADHSPDVRAKKRARFAPPAGRRKSAPRVPVLVVAGLALLAGAALLLQAWRGAGDRAAPASVPALADAGGTISLPLATFDDGRAHFYTHQAGDVSIEYFVLRSSDGVVRAAFDSCDVCFPAQKGYRQEGDEMVCNNCGQRFPSVHINEVSGGCNPAPLARTVDGDQLVIRVEDLIAGVGYFE